MHPSIAHQTTDQLGGPLSVLVRQKRDHGKLAALMKRLGNTGGEDRGRVLLDIYRLVVPWRKPPVKSDEKERP